jgi:hypothetical protein
MTQPSREKAGSRVARLTLMDAGLNFAHRMRATLQTSAEDTARFTLPVWVGEDRNVRIGLPVEEPHHGADVLQLIVPLDELLTTVGHAFGEAQSRERLTDALGEPKRGVGFDTAGEVLWLIYHRADEPDPSTVVTTLADDREQAKRKAQKVLGGNPDTYVATPLTRPETEVWSA